MSLPRQVNPWSQEVRRQAYVAVQIAAAKRTACERTFRYFLCSARAHGLTAQELSRASGLGYDEVLRLTDPAAA